MGLPILDSVITLHSWFDGSAVARQAFSRSDFYWDEQPIVWVVCLGLGMSPDGAKMFNLFPREGTTYVYILPKDLVNPDPYETLRVHRECTDQILEDLRALPAGVRVSVLSISAGNAFGFYIANNYPVERFLAVVTGAGIGKELFWSLACIPVARQTRRLGYTGETYNAVLRGRLPIENIANLPARTHFYLGLADAQIPFWFGLKIYRRVKEYNPDAKLSLFWLGHIGTLYMVGRFLKERTEPTIYGVGDWLQYCRRWLAYTALRVPFRDAPMLIGGLVLGFDRLNRLLAQYEKPAS
jgi:hypothetical protein